MSNQDKNAGNQDSDPFQPKDPAPAKQEGRVRSVSGIDGLAARYVQSSASWSVAPSTLDIRKARRAASRARTMNACDGCKAARCKVILDKFHAYVIKNILLSFVKPITWLAVLWDARSRDLFPIMWFHFRSFDRTRCSDTRPCPRCVKHGLASSCDEGSGVPASSSAAAWQVITIRCARL